MSDDWKTGPKECGANRGEKTAFWSWGVQVLIAAVGFDTFLFLCVRAFLQPRLPLLHAAPAGPHCCYCSMILHRSPSQRPLSCVTFSEWLCSQLNLTWCQDPLEVQLWWSCNELRGGAVGAQEADEADVFALTGPGERKRMLTWPQHKVAVQVCLYMRDLTSSFNFFYEGLWLKLLVHLSLKCASSLWSNGQLTSDWWIEILKKMKYNQTIPNTSMWVIRLISFFCFKCDSIHLGEVREKIKRTN